MQERVTLPRKRGREDRVAHDDDREQAVSPAEGVRILGAQPAGAPAVPNVDRPDVDLVDGPSPDGPSVDRPGGDRPGGEQRAVRWPAEGPSWTAGEEPIEAQLADLDDDLLPTRALPKTAAAGRDEDPGADTDGPDTSGTTGVPSRPDVDEPASSEVPELPHWSEPPTGAMPAIFDQDDGDAEPDDWSALAGAPPRFRAEESAKGSDWAERGFAEQLAEATAGDEQGGALGDPEADPNASDEEFAAAVAQRRRSGTRQVTTPRRTPRPARPARPARPTTSAFPDFFGDSAGRNLPVALATAGALAVVALLCFIAGEGATALLATVIIGAAAVELLGTLNRKNLRSAHLVVLAGAAAMPIAAWSDGLYGYALVWALVVLTTLVWFLVGAGPGRPLIGSATTLLAFAWVGGLGGFAGLLLSLPDGVEWLLAALLPVIAYDVFGYFVGQQFGKSPIAPNVSPNKTIEGTSVGILAAVLVGFFAVARFDPFTDNSRWGVYVGLAAGFAALFGDLSESMIKRDLGIKDFSGTLPGHGGVLDRFDGLLFAMPVIYFLAILLNS